MKDRFSRKERKALENTLTAIMWAQSEAKNEEMYKFWGEVFGTVNYMLRYPKRKG